MQASPVIAVFDVGKTNKKMFLFNDQYRVVYEENAQLAETTDEDGFPCEDVRALTSWIRQGFQRLCSYPDFEIKALNFSAYGASFVHVDEKGAPCAPLYNYLKPFPEKLQNGFFETHGEAALLSRQTASPVLGNLNSGLQLYRLKHEKPDVFNKIKYALHLPQYLSRIFSNSVATEITSIGCHTLLWDFEKNAYHDWVSKEGLLQRLAPLLPGDKTVKAVIHNKTIYTGIGLHDSSAALIPYLVLFQEPFVLLSTGTWCISMNPFCSTLLTGAELKQDCLCYLSYTGKPVKAARLFAGYEHEQQVKRLAAHFHKAPDFYKTIGCDMTLLKTFQALENEPGKKGNSNEPLFSKRDLTQFRSYEEAYHQLIIDLVQQQVESTRLVLDGPEVRRIFVDGGFGKNLIYMHLLAAAFPETSVFAASVAQATALGAALAIHSSWNTRPLPKDLIDLKQYSIPQPV